LTLQINVGIRNYGLITASWDLLCNAARSTSHNYFHEKPNHH